MNFNPNAHLYIPIGTPEKKPTMDIIMRNKVQQGRKRGVFPMLRTKVHGEKIAKAAISNCTVMENHSHQKSNISNKGYNGAIGEVDYLTLSTKNFTHGDVPGIPDIQMINRYYGLVPKKFIISSRTSSSEEISSKPIHRRRANSAANLIGLKEDRKSTPPRATNEPSRETLKDKDKRNEPRHVIGNNAVSKTIGENGTAAVVAKKMPVEKPSKRLRPPVTKVLNGNSNKVKTLNIMDTTESHANPFAQQQQRIIKIDLNNMSWEESFPSSTTTIVQPDNESLYSDSSEDCCKNVCQVESAFSCKLQDGDDMILETHQTSCTTPTDEYTKHAAISTTTTLPSSNNEDPDRTLIETKASDEVKCGTPTSSSHRQLGLRKTVSFDEQLIPSHEQSNQPIENSQKTEKRPMTANTSSKHVQNPPSKVPSWTTKFQHLTLAEKRAKFQRGVSIQSSTDSTFDFGGGESDDTERIPYPIISITNKKSSTILANGSNKRCKPVLPPPEVTTMISSQTNEQQKQNNIQQEIDKVAAILKDFQTRTENLIGSEKNAFESIQVQTNQSEPLSHTSHQVHTCAKDSLLSNNAVVPINRHKTFDINAQCSNNNYYLDASQTNNVDDKNTTSKPGNKLLIHCVDNNNISKSEKVELTHSLEKRRPRPLLKKAVSISCEKELYNNNNPAAGLNPWENESTKPNSHHHSSNSNTTGRLKSARVTFSQSRSASLSKLQNNCGSKSSCVEPRRSSSDDQKKNESNGSNSSVGGKNNKKILIKKALIEINQSSISLRRKWGVMGRPKTASGALGEQSERRNETGSVHRGKRMPLKVTHDSIVHSTLKAGGKSTSGESNLNKGGSNNMDQKRDEDFSNSLSQTQESKDGGSEVTQRRRGMLTRQSISLDEDMLASYNENATRLDTECNTLSAKKKEECMKIYEKMTKTGCTIKLDTIFRGMLTPSEYRVFMKETELAAKQAAAEEAASNLIESTVINDAGVSEDTIDTASINDNVCTTAK